MSGLLRHWKLILAGCCLAAFAWCWGPGLAADVRPADAGPTRRPGPVDAAGKPLPRLFYGTRACAGGSCHENGHTDDPLLLCRCDELDRWRADDKHADAFKVLEGERGRQMLKILGYKGPRDAKECLVCHAVVAPEGEKHRSFRLDEGVSCVVCHGPYEEWVGLHGLYLSRERFRRLSPQEKEGRYGMTNLRDLRKRTSLCVSCHVGNASTNPDERKIVTHDMYAAGHPPLPGFEMASFSNMMPRHWQYLAEKPAAVQKLLGYDGSEQEQAKLVLVGAAVALAESMRLLAMQAEECRETADPDKMVLDLASYDCWSCHHDLRSKSWRQLRAPTGIPGRVPMKTWPAELMKVVVSYLGDDQATFDKLQEDLKQAFAVRPYGDVAMIAKSAGALAAWADGLAGRLNKVKLDRDRARKLLQLIPANVEKTPDYDPARQRGWAYQAVHGELSDSKEEPAALLKLSKYLGLRLPVGRMKEGDREGVIVRALGESLKRINEYDPETFKKLLRDLGGAAGR